MYRIFLFIALVASAVSVSASSWNLKDALGGLTGDKGSTSGLGSALGNLLSTDKITVSQIVGDWKYQAPAVEFKSDDVLKRAGGAAASAALVEKLKPYYAKTGFDKARLSVQSDSSFVLSAGKVTLRGTVSEIPETAGSQANFMLDFAVGGKIPIGKMEAYVTKNISGDMSVTFDVSRLITLLEAAGTLTNNGTLKGVVALLKSYDGLCAGFEMSRQ